MDSTFIHRDKERVNAAIAAFDAAHNKPGSDIVCALGVLILSERTRQWLLQNDPKALEQAQRALSAFKG
jgi:hypothetical protein